jgi:hypothetical protein
MALAVLVAGSTALYALGAPGASPSVRPASSQGMGDMMTNPAIIGSIAGGMGLLFFLGWWMRRQTKHRARR